MDDIFDVVLRLFEHGHPLSAIQRILPKPTSSYDDVSSDEKAFQYLINYIDASIFWTIYESLHTNQLFQILLETEPTLCKRWSKVLLNMEYEKKLLTMLLLSNEEFAKTQSLSPSLYKLLKSIREGSFLQKHEISQAILDVPVFYRACLEGQIQLSQGWSRLTAEKPFLKADCPLILSLPPVHAFKYQNMNLEALEFRDEEIPCIFLAPASIDYQSLLKPLINRPALFVFDTFVSFKQMLQFPDVVELLKDPEHIIYILDRYPNGQISQQRPFVPLKKFYAITFLDNPSIVKNLEILLRAFEKAFSQQSTDLHSDTPISNCLYQIGKKIVFGIQEERLGKCRLSALHENQTHYEWNDSHKGGIPVDEKIEVYTPDLYYKHLLELYQKRWPKRLPKKNKIHIAHVVAQIVNNRHAPSKLLTNLLNHADRQSFDLTLICTERMITRLKEYPLSPASSVSSAIRGAEVLTKFQTQGIDVFLADEKLSFQETINLVCHILYSANVDVAVFHGPDVINDGVCQQTDVPLKVLFEHGSQAKYPGYDVAFLSSHDALEIYKQHYEGLGTKAIALPFAYDAKKDWLEKPFRKQDFNLPDNSFLLTTISNHLDSRLGEEMCLAISEILQRCPNAWYTPIGCCDDTLKTRFSKYNVCDRVRFLGAQSDPSQCARMMRLYLNEFPFGSGLGIIDAMAAGCPVVSMYDPSGPQQGRYGGIYYGIDRAITSLDRRGYVDLACRLIEDEDMYDEWSLHALKAYERLSDVASYVKKFENYFLEIGKEWKEENLS